MGTNFFARQDAARRTTTWLICWFIVAVVLLVATMFVVATLATGYLSGKPLSHTLAGIRTEPGEPQPALVGLIVGVGTLVLILGGTLYKVSSLRRGGGRGVAESLGGKLLHGNTEDLSEQRLMNVVEEMAIASGTPVPPVYLLDEDAINAFAAGYAPGDAVLGVTRGACERLSRDELQGVIAHEFSHVLNGDMRMNIRLIGILHGILLLSLIGQMILRSLWVGGGRRRDKKDAQGVLVLLAIGLTLFLLGSLGALIGGLIKAGVSRQREYLADASAVQFTRSVGGIKGALLRIGARQAGSRLRHPNASEASHMYFAQGVFEGLSGLMATHPPLPKRIRAIDPSWDGRFPQPLPDRGRRDVHRGQAQTPRGAAGFAASGDVASEAAGAAPGTAPNAGEDMHAFLERARRQRREADAWDEAPLAVVRDAANRVGAPESLHQRYAAELLAEIPSALRAAARETSTARSVVVALLLDRNPEIRQRQTAAISLRLEPIAVREAERFLEPLSELPAACRLPLLDLTLPALAGMSLRQYGRFSASLDDLIAADSRVSLFEWTLAQVMQRHLRPHFRPVRSPTTRYYSLRRLGGPVSALLSTVSRVGHRDETILRAFEAGRGVLPGVELQLLPAETCTLDTVREALDVLSTVSAPRLQELVAACAAAVCVDDRVTVAEAELLRGIADLLDCPIPPLIDVTRRGKGVRYL